MRYLSQVRLRAHVTPLYYLDTQFDDMEVICVLFRRVPYRRVTTKRDWEGAGHEDMDYFRRQGRCKITPYHDRPSVLASVNEDEY